MCPELSPMRNAQSNRAVSALCWADLLELKEPQASSAIDCDELTSCNNTRKQETCHINRSICCLQDPWFQNPRRRAWDVRGLPQKFHAVQTPQRNAVAQVTPQRASHSALHTVGTHDTFLEFNWQDSHLKSFEKYLLRTYYAPVTFCSSLGTRSQLRKRFPEGKCGPEWDQQS